MFVSYFPYFRNISIPNGTCRHFELSNPPGLRNLFDRFYHDVSAFSLAYAQAFVLSLYKRDTTRMVGRHTQEILKQCHACIMTHVNFSYINQFWVHGLVN